MNIRRGLLRLWIVGSIAWIFIVGFHGYRAYSSLGPLGPWTFYQAIEGGKIPTAEELYERIMWLKERELVLKGREIVLKGREIVRLHLEWGLGPPAAILVVEASLGWALAGFRGTRRGNTP
jgi:hypothetical protein